MILSRSRLLQRLGAAGVGRVGMVAALNRELGDGLGSGRDIRHSARVKTVAAILDQDESQVRRLIAKGDLEGHRTGKRGVRIYLDSVRRYQERNRIDPNKSRTEKGLAKSPRARNCAAAHQTAMAKLRARGLV